MRSNTLNRRDITTGLALLLAASCAAAQTLPGLWGSPLYRVQLNVSGSTVSGTFTSIENPQAPPGSISGQLLAGGRGFTAAWTAPAGPDTVTFSTYLSFGARGSLLTGYRWSDETEPASFALHRAVNGQVPAVIGPEEGSGVGPGGGTGSGSVAGVEVIICESVVDGQPRNIADRFAAPKTVAAMVRCKQLPANTSLAWTWTLNGNTEAQFSKTVSGSGWHMHGLKSETAIIPGTYTVVVTVNGQEAARRTIVVAGPGGGATGGTSGGTTGTSSLAGNVELIICERAPEGVPENVATEFVAPKSVTALVKYTRLPAGTTIQFIWTRDGQPRAELTRTKEGTGWQSHSLTSDTALTPGRYHVSLLVNGRSAAERDITVRAAGSGPTTTTTPTVLATFALKGPSWVGTLAKRYDRNRFGVKLGVTWTKPGAILDTVGINAAPVGSFSVIVDGAGKTHLQVYAPSCNSAYKQPNGWHVLPSPLTVKADQPCEMMVTIEPPAWGFRVSVGGREQTVTLSLPVPASGDPIYVGDFPGDNNWPASLNPHRGMTGTVQVLNIIGRTE